MVSPPESTTAPVKCGEARMPTLVRDDAVTVALSVAPESVPAAAVTVMAAEPSKFTPLIARVVARFVALAASPVQLPDEPDVFPVTLPVRLAVTVVAVIVPINTADVLLTVSQSVPPSRPLELTLNRPPDEAEIQAATSPGFVACECP